MNIQFDTIGSAMQKVLRDIRIQDMSLKNDIIEWVADGLEQMNTTNLLAPQNKTVELKNYGATLPCGIKSIQAVICDGVRIRYGQNNFEDYRNLNYNNYIKYWTVKPLEIVPNEYHQIGMTYIQASINQLEQVSQYEIYKDLYYHTVGRQLESNLEKGTLDVYYLGTYTDKDGYPLIPRNVYIKEAITNYVDYRLTRAGYKEGRWDILLQLWEQSANRAMNNIQFPSPEEVEVLMHETLGLIKPY